MSISRQMRRLALASVTAVAVVAGAPAATADPKSSTWHITELGTLVPGVCCSTATGVNDRGEVVGDSNLSFMGYTHAFLWRNGRMLDLGTLGTNSYATAINNRGEIVGFSQLTSGDLHAFRWRDGRMTDLGSLDGAGSIATSINDHGEIVGYSFTAGGGLRAFIWRAGVMRDLGTLNGGSAIAYDINNRGQVVGESTLDGMNSVPVLWERGDIRVLDNRYGVARAINDHGQVAGRFYNGIAFLWYRGRLIELLAAQFTAQVNGINKRGQVVGATAFEAFVWADGRLTTLPSFGGGANATGINDRSQVVGNATTPGGNPTAVFWTRR